MAHYRNVTVNYHKIKFYLKRYSFKQTMKIKLLFLAVILSLSFVSAQKTNKIDCRITYLPSIKYDSATTIISKDLARKIDSLVALKTFKITFTENDIVKIKELYSKKSIDGTKIFDVSDSVYCQMLNEKQFTLHFNEIEKLPLKSIVDVLGSVIDGAPFRLTAITNNNTFKFENNFAGGPKFKELKNYLVFYTIYQETKFCGVSNKSAETYFSRDYFLKTLLHCIDRIEKSRL